jgi:hypothetical protein
VPKKLKVVEDLSGMIFGDWKVIQRLENTLDNKKLWLCECKCGAIKKVVTSYLKCGLSKRCQSCGSKQTWVSRKKNKYTALDSLIVAQRYNSGEASTKLAREYQIRASTVLKYVKNHGFKARTIQEHGTRRRKPPGISGFNRIYKYYKKGAKYKYREFFLSKEQFRGLVEKPCFYCGSEPYNKAITSAGVFTYSGVDRVDSGVGYILENVVPCCTVCNRAKSDMSFDNFIWWIERFKGRDLWVERLKIMKCNALKEAAIG